MSNTSVAQTILRQLGGNQFIAMTGSKNFLGGKNYLSMHLTRNKANAKFLTITLNEMDTYEMKFQKEKRILNKQMTAAFGKRFYTTELVTLKTYENVYWEDLQTIFTNFTGLYTKF